MRSKKIDTVLWNNLKLGSMEALGDLYDLFIDTLFSYGMQYSQDKQFIMDCIHDLFLDLYKYRKSLANTDNVKYYLLRSLKNKIVKSKKEHLIGLTNEVSCSKNDSLQQEESFEAHLVNEEFINEREVKLANAVSKLSKKQRQILFLRFTEEREYEEIAQLMNVSVQTSRTTVYRAIKELRKYLSVILYFFLTFL